MGQLLLPKWFGYQPGVKPTVPVEIDWSHPLAEGLVFYQIGMQDLISGSIAKPTVQWGASNSGRHFSRSGFALESHSVTAGGFEFAGTAIKDLEGSLYFTAMVLAKQDSGASTGSILSVPSIAASGAGSRTFNWEVKSTENARNAITVSTGLVISQGASSFHKITGEAILYTFVKNDTTTVRRYRDGVFVESSVVTGFDLAMLTGTDDSVFILQEARNADDGLDGKSYLNAMWKREFSPGEVAQFHADPYALLKPRVPVLYYTAVAGGAQTDKSISFGMTTGMALTAFPIRPKAISFGMVTGMTLAKTTSKTISVGFPISVALTKITNTTKTVSFVTAMALTKAFVAVKAISVSFATAMTLTKVPTFIKAIALGFTTAMALAKTTQKTFTVGFTTAFTLAKTTKAAKVVSFVTSMVRTTTLQAFQAIAFSAITTMSLSAAKVFVKAISVGFVTAFTTATSFVAGLGVTGSVLWLLRRRRR